MMARAGIEQQHGRGTSAGYIGLAVNAEVLAEDNRTLYGTLLRESEGGHLLR